MAIDTAYKRRASAASRRMPWMRRFGIAPTGAIGFEQRVQGAWVYGGIELAELVTGSGSFAEGMVFCPGIVAGEVSVPGFKAGDVYVAGFQQGQSSP